MQDPFPSRGAPEASPLNLSSSAPHYAPSPTTPPWAGRNTKYRSDVAAAAPEPLTLHEPLRLAQPQFPNTLLSLAAEGLRRGKGLWARCACLPSLLGAGTSTDSSGWRCPQARPGHFGRVPIPGSCCPGAGFSLGFSAGCSAPVASAAAVQPPPGGAAQPPPPGAARTPRPPPSSQQRVRIPIPSPRPPRRLPAPPSSRRPAADSREAGAKRERKRRGRAGARRAGRGARARGRGRCRSRRRGRGGARRHALPSHAPYAPPLPRRTPAESRTG